MASNNNGTVWIKDTRLFVKDPGDGGSHSRVTPCEGIELIINGTRVIEKTIVSEKDSIEIKISQMVLFPGSFKITIPPDGLSAIMSVETGLVRQYSLPDCEPAEDLIMKATFEEQATCPITTEELASELNKRTITYGLNKTVIDSLLAVPQSGDFIIAEGYPPGETIDDTVELITDKKSESDVDDRNKKIDFREMVEILSVEQGEILARKHPGKEGEEGMRINGKAIPAAKQYLIELVAGNGAETFTDGQIIRAINSGSPVVKKTGNRYHISIQPVLTHRGDINLASGNIRFKGDVKVMGAVREGMAVMASGKVEIGGMVFESKISALQGIAVKQNITGSNLLSGGNTALVSSFFSIIDPLRDDLVEITNLIPNLAKHPKLQNTKTGQLAQFLIDKKYPRVPNFINELFKLAESNNFGLPSDMTELIGIIDSHLRGLNILKLESPDQLTRIVESIDAAHASMEREADKKADISFPYAVNSSVEASGNVNVTGRGCINTTIRAAGNVSIAGVFRGGDIFAAGDVTINEAGSELGARTLIRTRERQKVMLKKVYEGVRIQIGDRQATISTAQSNVRAEMSKDGKSILVGGNTL
ncbi:MAG: FapA family protein [Peptococcaceae bacterium]|nr:FapA family protein [Peptococcaceae bacterium]